MEPQLMRIVNHNFHTKEEQFLDALHLMEVHKPRSIDHNMPQIMCIDQHMPQIICIDHNMPQIICINISICHRLFALITDQYMPQITLGNKNDGSKRCLGF